jgi:hypothetical protein
MSYLDELTIKQMATQQHALRHSSLLLEQALGWQDLLLSSHQHSKFPHDNSASPV